MSQICVLIEKNSSELDITTTEQSMQIDKSPQNSNPFDVVYNHRQKIYDDNRKLFYLSRRKFLRQQRKLQSEKKRESLTNNLRQQRQMELVESFISLDCSASQVLQQNSSQIQRADSKRKNFLFQNMFQPFQYRS